MKAIWLPKKGHPKEDSLEAQGNRVVDIDPQEVALEPEEPLQVLVMMPEPTMTHKPTYTSEEEN